jgi:hypothetical protein
MTDNTVSHNYAAYGLTIRSPIPLTEFVFDGTGEGDVEVTFGEDPGWVSAVRGEDLFFHVSREEARFWFKDVGAFVVRAGSQIVAIPENALDHSLLRLYIQGIMMATVLHQRGMCVLHASVIEIHGAALAFLGPVGFGKSSLAGALYSRGHRVLADDNAAIEFRSGIPMIRTAYPSLKLFPEIASSLGFRNGSLTALHSSEVKIAGAVREGFVQEPLPVRGLYFLGRDCDGEITRLAPMQAAMELVRNSVPTRWGHPGDMRQLQDCGLIAKQVPAFSLKTFTDLASLPILAETVENHCTELAGISG